MGTRDLHLTSATPYMSQEWLQLESPACAVCAVHLMQPLPNYFGMTVAMILSQCRVLYSGLQ